VRRRRSEFRVETSVKMDHATEDKLSGGATNAADIRSVADPLHDGKKGVPVGDHIQISCEEGAKMS
jgi:hypothetical protein